MLLLVPGGPISHQPPNCEAFIAWLSILDKELAGMAGRTMELVQPRAVNLFRDGYFVPLAGKPFEKTTPEERRQYYSGIRQGCYMQLAGEAREIFRRWDVVVQRAFIMPEGQFSGAAIIAGLAERRALLARMKVAGQTHRAPTRENFEALNREVATAKVELAKLWPREEKEILATLVAGQQALAQVNPEGARIATIVNAEAGVEGSQSGGVPTKNDYVYVDAVIAKGGNGNLETLPVEQVFQWLFDAKFKCLSTTHVVWRGLEGSAAAVQFGTKRFVIDCRGNCRGLRYRVNGRTDAQWWHYGLSQPVPVVNLKSNDLSTNNFSWIFKRDSSTDQAPVVRIHAWSSIVGDYGPGCKID